MYNPIFKEKIIKNKFLIKQDSNFIKFNSIKINHGETPTFGFIFNDIAYLSDCKSIPSNSLKKLLKLKLLIIDCLKFKKHPTHLNYNECMEIIQKIKPKKTILTNLHSDLDYKKLRVKLKKNFPNIFPAYDGMKIII
jgi:phosphoribosyl 1,2-cyclic phosphate phosphodiesterase